MGLIRLFLALVVAADHYITTALHRAGAAADVSGVQDYVGLNAGFAVMFFYVISGFLISYALAHKYGAGPQGRRAFYTSRFIRIFSVYWPLLAIGVVLFGSRTTDPAEWLVSLVLLGSDWMLPFSHYPVDKSPFPVPIGQAWTLGAELTFYLLAPWILRSPRAAWACFAASLAVRFGVAAGVGTSMHPTWGYHFFPSTLCFFLLGHFARAAHDRGIRLPVPGAVVLFGAAIAAMTPASRGQEPAFYAGILLFATALPSIFEATKDRRWLNMLGELSYPLYLVHMMVLQAFAPFGPIPLLFDSAAALTALFAGAVLAVTVVVHHVIERPVAAALRRLLGGRGAGGFGRDLLGRPLDVRHVPDA